MLWKSLPIFLDPMSIFRLPSARSNGDFMAGKNNLIQIKPFVFVWVGGWVALPELRSAGKSFGDIFSEVG
jgi:hypothetical protein